ncbi:shikimate dehydrogenase [Echinimonas agarilytica]|uniref:Shikimate dehydrogenase (NADP(+)) n=1 Tax=Echinimonas agarilytica TaxID=1215918 RepID=A0AA42B5P9_9GAMM|nr:shikimate dehydrogenase [Echinimonas agarilytica]MCM2678053.1 shikimate dehydrogenase [Echinimonas agarilytica]
MDQYAVFGHPIKQSKSPFIHRLFAEQTQQQLEYGAIEPAEDGFVEAATAFFNNGGKGCNITMPFKLDAYHFATQLTERARMAGAVNTLKVLDDGGILGDNTDGAGLVADLLLNHVALEGKRVLMIGAGGAARGTLLPLLEQNVVMLQIVNRTTSKAQDLVDLFPNHQNIEATTFDALEAAEPFDVIINSTSASMSGELPPIPTSIINQYSSVYDMVYRQEPTVFINWAKQQGAAKGIDGLGMLVAQAAESFAVWRGIRPSMRQVLRELNKNLGRI